jgi:acyl-CoA synthetase (AMP-forming)/AMP-acid ligase II
MMNGELFVAGREKEIIKRNGATISPHDLEWVAERHLNLRTGRAAAFSIIDHQLARERIILLVEAPPGKMTREVNRSLGSAILNSTGIQVDQIMFVGLNGIPRTTSGKLRRDAARSRFVMT